MRIAYFTTDEVNQDLAVRMAENCGIALHAVSPNDAPPDGRFDAVLYDWDYWPVHWRREILQELLRTPVCGIVALHAYHLEDEQVQALQLNGVATFRRLELEIFEFLARKAGPSRGVLVRGAAPAEGLTREQAAPLFPPSTEVGAGT